MISVILNLKKNLVTLYNQKKSPHMVMYGQIHV